MESVIIFPHTVWERSDIGFHEIQELSKELQKIVNHKVMREYQAVVFELANFNETVLGTILRWLPVDCELPSILNGQCAIISNQGLMTCATDNMRFKQLLTESHLTVTTQGGVDEIPELTYQEINVLCDEFADTEGLLLPLKELDIEKILQSINIDPEYERKLVGILVDLKSIWFALDYDTLQLGRHTGSTANERFKRYLYVNNAIVRIRALWEKLMAFAILIERPKDMDKILSARRVRAAFISNFENTMHPITKLIWDYIHSLDTFEQRFRTPEIHKVGRTIWWAAREKLGEETNRFLAFRNDLNILMRKIVDFYVETGK